MNGNAAKDKPKCSKGSFARIRSLVVAWQCFDKYKHTSGMQEVVESFPEFVYKMIYMGEQRTLGGEQITLEGRKFLDKVVSAFASIPDKYDRSCLDIISGFYEYRNESIDYDGYIGHSKRSRDGLLSSFGVEENKGKFKYYFKIQDKKCTSLEEAIKAYCDLDNELHYCSKRKCGKIESERSIFKKNDKNECVLDKKDGLPVLGNHYYDDKDLCRKLPTTKCPAGKKAMAIGIPVSILVAVVCAVYFTVKYVR